jgi:hypothetical protein
MNTETNKSFTFAWGTAAVAADTAFLRRAALRRPALTPICPRPLSRHALRRFRQAESRLLLAIQSSSAGTSTDAATTPVPFAGQRRELVLLLLYAAALLLMIAAAFLDPGSFVQSWAQLVQKLRGF